MFTPQSVVHFLPLLGPRAPAADLPTHTTQCSNYSSVTLKYANAGRQSPELLEVILGLVRPVPGEAGVLRICRFSLVLLQKLGKG